jgi:hypothetical protein
VWGQLLQSQVPARAQARRRGGRERRRQWRARWRQTLKSARTTRVGAGRGRRTCWPLPRELTAQPWEPPHPSPVTSAGAAVGRCEGPAHSLAAGRMGKERAAAATTVTAGSSAWASAYGVGVGPSPGRSMGSIGPTPSSNIRADDPSPLDNQRGQARGRGGAAPRSMLEGSAWQGPPRA